MIRSQQWMLGLSVALTTPLALIQCSNSSGGAPGSGLPDASANGSRSGSSSGISASSSGVASSSSGSGSSSGMTSSSSGSSSGGGASSSSSGVLAIMDAGDANEGGPIDAADTGSACDMPDGGEPCTPGFVPCGGDAGECPTSTSACCAPLPLDGGPQGTCQPSTTSCNTGMAKIQCNEAADCPSGYVCCESFLGYAMLGTTSCMQSCSPPSNYQICRTNSECAGGGSDSGASARCIPQTCTPPMGGGFGGGGGPTISIEACAVPAGMGMMMNGGALAACTPR